MSRASLLMAKNSFAKTLEEQDAKTNNPFFDDKLAPNKANCLYFFFAISISFLFFAKDGGSIITTSKVLFFEMKFCKILKASPTRVV